MNQGSCLTRARSQPTESVLVVNDLALSTCDCGHVAASSPEIRMIAELLRACTKCPVRSERGSLSLSACCQDSAMPYLNRGRCHGYVAVTIQLAARTTAKRVLRNKGVRTESCERFTIKEPLKSCLFKNRACVHGGALRAAAQRGTAAGTRRGWDSGRCLRSSRPSAPPVACSAPPPPAPACKARGDHPRPQSGQSCQFQQQPASWRQTRNPKPASLSDAEFTETPSAPPNCSVKSTGKHTTRMMSVHGRHEKSGAIQWCTCGSRTCSTLTAHLQQT